MVAAPRGCRDKVSVKCSVILMRLWVMKGWVVIIGGLIGRGRDVVAGHNGRRAAMNWMRRPNRNKEKRHAASTEDRAPFTWTGSSASCLIGT